MRNCQWGAAKSQSVPLALATMDALNDIFDIFEMGPRQS
jgi:hypothetical protein